MKNPTSLLSFALLAAALGTPAASAQSLPPASTASIMFTRTALHTQDATRSTSLYRISPAGGAAVPLTPWTQGIDYRGGSWSPSGSSVVYEKARQATPDQSQLFVVDRQGGAPRRITTGPYRHQQASWGPGSVIAFVTDMGDQQCLSVVQADGQDQHNVFCPYIRTRPSTPPVMSTPQWSHSGNSVYIESAAYDDNLDENRWISEVWRVNVTNGQVTEFTRRSLDDVASLTIAPNGAYGVYAYTGFLAPMIKAYFDGTDAQTLLPQGYAPRYSPDGSQIAFIRPAATSTDVSNGTVYVMQGDGTGEHPAVAMPDPDAAYAIADWSQDGTRLLLNKVDDQHVMQILKLSTGTATSVSKGTARGGAWYQH